MSLPPSFSPALIDEIIALDALTLSSHTIAATGAFDLAAHRASLEARLAEDVELVCIHRQDRLVAYGLYGSHPQAAAGDYFVYMLITHPDHRNAATLRRLWLASRIVFERRGVQQLISHVYRTNPLSIAMHERLGFTRRKENPLAIEFVATLSGLNWPGYRGTVA